MTAEQNYRLLQAIDANRLFILQACRDNPDLLARAEPRIRQWFEAVASLPPAVPGAVVADNEKRA